MQHDAYGLGATQITLGVLGASVFPTVFKCPSGVCGVQFKLLGAAGSTVQILPTAIVGATVGGATAVIAGYPLVTGEMYPIDGPSSFYIAATGATATVAALFIYSAQGVTLA